MLASSLLNWPLCTCCHCFSSDHHRLSSFIINFLIDLFSSCPLLLCLRYLYLFSSTRSCQTHKKLFISLKMHLKHRSLLPQKSPMSHQAIKLIQLYDDSGPDTPRNLFFPLLLSPCIASARYLHKCHLFWLKCLSPFLLLQKPIHPSRPHWNVTSPEMPSQIRGASIKCVLYRWLYTTVPLCCFAGAFKLTQFWHQLHDLWPFINCFDFSLCSDVSQRSEYQYWKLD